jgi:predicted transcriptional regulator YheO
LRVGPYIIARRYIYAEKKHTIVEICRLMGISKPTLYNYVAEAGA